MATWLDGIVDEKVWREQGRRLLIVCPNPNEEWMEHKGDARRDMRELLRRPEGARKAFYIHLRQAVRAFHNLPSRSSPGEEQDHDDLVRRIAFVDLKNTGGGPRVDPVEVMEATEIRRGELVAQILSIEPSHIAVAGAAAQEAFGRHIRQHIPPSTKVCGIRHPSWRYGKADEYYRRVQAQMASEFPHVQWQPVGYHQPSLGLAGAPAQPRAVSTPDIVSLAQLSDWRRRILQLLNLLDAPGNQPTGESVAARIGRLSRGNVIPREIAAAIRIVTEMRNAAEYQSKVLSETESTMVAAAYRTIQEWARSRNLKFP